MSDPRGRSPDHLDLDTLADALAGDLPERGTAASHLRGCPSCTRRVSELAAGEVAVAASLATLPAPPLPDGLSERLAAALRAQASGEAARSPIPRAAADRPRRAPSVRLPQRSRPWLPAVAAAGALLLAGGLGWGVLQTGGGASGGDAASGAGGNAGRVGELAGVARSSTGTDYADDRRRAAVLRQVLSGQASEQAVRDDAGPLARLREPGPLQECLAALRSSAPGTGTVLALDYARFGAGPALAIVLPDDDPARLSLRVVGPACGRADPDLLLVTRVVRPR